MEHGINVRTYVAGEKHYQEALSSVGEGRHKGRLVRDAGNKFDANAVAVYVGETHVGHVPAWRSKTLGPRMDDHGALAVEVDVEVFAPTPSRPRFRAEIVP